VSADRLLDKLNGVKRTGADRWIANCPAHDDKRPSLNIRELGDGRLLIICRAQCATEDVLASVGLTFEDLYPERLPEHHYRREQRPFPAADVLRAVSFEALVAGIILGRLGAGHALSGDDRQRAFLACERLIAAADLALPSKDRRLAHLEARRVAETRLEEATA
jgi:hypothetical protein